MQEMIGIADFVTVAVIMDDLSQADTSAIPNAFSLTIIMVWFPEEATDCLYGQFSPAVVVNQSFVVCRSAFSDFSAFGIMDIYTERQSQTEESFSCQAYPPLCYVYRFFHKTR